MFKNIIDFYSVFNDFSRIDVFALIAFCIVFLCLTYNIKRLVNDICILCSQFANVFNMYILSSSIRIVSSYRSNDIALESNGNGILHYVSLVYRSPLFMESSLNFVIHYTQSAILSTFVTITSNILFHHAINSGVTLRTLHTPNMIFVLLVSLLILPLILILIILFGKIMIMYYKLKIHLYSFMVFKSNSVNDNTRDKLISKIAEIESLYHILYSYDESKLEEVDDSSSIGYYILIRASMNKMNSDTFGKTELIVVFIASIVSLSSLFLIIRLSLLI